MYRQCIGNVSAMYRQLYRKCVDVVSDMYRQCIGNVSAMYRQLYRKCIDVVSNMYRQCIGNVSAMYRQCIVITIQITIHCRYALDTVAYFSDFQPAISLYRGPHAASVSGCIVICISICIGICIGLVSGCIVICISICIGICIGLVSGCIVICISICIGICIGLVSGLYLIPIQSLDQRTSTYVSTSYRRRILAYRKFTCIGIEIRQNSDTPDTRQIHPDTPRYSRGEKGTVLVGKKELQPTVEGSGG
jgi:hypothetical protein